MKKNKLLTADSLGWPKKGIGPVSYPTRVGAYWAGFHLHPVQLSDDVSAWHISHVSGGMITLKFQGLPGEVLAQGRQAQPRAANVCVCARNRRSGEDQRRGRWNESSRAQNLDIPVKRKQNLSGN